MMWNLNNTASRTILCLFLTFCSLSWQSNIAFVLNQVAIGYNKPSIGRRQVSSGYQTKDSANGKSVLHVSTNTDNYACNLTDTTSMDEQLVLEYLLRENKGKRRRQRKRRDRLEELHSRSSSRSSSISTSDGAKHVVEEKWMVQKEQQQPKDLKRFSLGLPPFLNNMSDLVKARLLLLCAAALYGTNFSFVKILGETDMSVGVSATLRFGMAALATMPWLLRVDGEDASTNAQHSLSSRWSKLTDPSGVEFQATMAGLQVGACVCMGYVAQAIGLETTAASKSAFLCSLAVVIVPILDVLIGKSMKPKQIMGALMAVVGVGVLELGGTDASSALSSLSFGDYCSLLQPLAFGMGFWKMEHAMRKFPDEANRTTAAQLLAVFLGSLAFVTVTSTVLPEGSLLHQPLPSLPELQHFLSDRMVLFSLFWTGIITTALTVYMETLSLKTLSAAETTIIFSTEPLWGTACAAALMGESLGMDAAIGAGLIVFGCLFSNLGLNGMLSFLLPSKGAKPQQQEELTPTAVDMDQTEKHSLKEPFLSVLPMNKLPQPTLTSGIAASFLAFFSRGPLLVGATEVDELVEKIVDSTTEFL